MIFSRRLLQGLILYFLSGIVSAYAAKPVVAIIIDDMGYRLEQDRDALSLSGPLTYSVLPHAPGAHHVLQAAKANGNEVMLHLPMESETQSRLPSPGTLTRSMDWITFVRTVQRNLSVVPDIVAVNNHEGSRLTADVQRMQWLMEELSRHRDIAFIDSRTTHRTVALQTAVKYGLPATRRDIFLDYEPGKIEEQFKKLIRKAKKEGSALAIAHPQDETIRYLNAHLDELKQQGIDLVPVSQLITKRQRSADLAGGSCGKRIGSNC